MNANVKILALNFPQFHPIPENDILWGKGFTEWTNVTKAKPLFRGHYQPQLPTDLGFYDLRLPEARQAQADLAREYGIHGICYYHYWLHGHRLLERPVNDIIASGKPDMPFCLCWANEHWTRKWDGLESEILVRQDYSDEDDLAHIRWLCEHPFRDPRYVRIDGKPVFLIYRAFRLPDPARTCRIWREEAYRLGIGEIYLCRMETFVDEIGDPTEIGFDAAVEFQPDWKNMGPPQRRGPFWRSLRKLGLSNRAFGNHRIYDYETVVKRMLRKEKPPYKRFPCVTPGWDNSPRKKTDGLIIRDSNPRLYEMWLTEAIRKFKPFSEDENLVFICALNEWAEGNHLEPCRRWGRAYLEATRRSLEGASLPETIKPVLKNSSRGREPAVPDWAKKKDPIRRSLNMDAASLFQRLRDLYSGSKSFNEEEKQLLQALDQKEVFIHLYNMASLAAERQDENAAFRLFLLIGGLMRGVNPDLAGKCHYKLALLSSPAAERKKHLEACLELYPEHRAARKLLYEIKENIATSAA
ncbi:MAG: glycoside hydrolase family 99-like domain-containing protein [Acidobacteria bacterium]|nr:glycoside hydrolase family 99-like domain-containing protein [Acidobacteriota bacterium]